MIPKYYLLFDFDGNLFNSAVSNPDDVDQVTVESATEWAIHNTFGPDALRAYHGIGGFQNRAPLELVTLMSQTPLWTQMSQHAKKFLHENYQQLLGFVAEGKGVPLTLESDITIEVATELLVREKLRIFSGKIGQKEGGEFWPQPCKGLVEFWQLLSQLRRELPIAIGIISSGHQLFIEEVFKKLELEPPDVLVTEDDSRGRHYPKEINRRVKPGLFPLALAHRELLLQLLQAGVIDENSLGIDTEITAINDPALSRYHRILHAAVELDLDMIYFGDDPLKDGGMAERATIPFGHFKPPGWKFKYPYDSVISFTDWAVVANILIESRAQLETGVALDTIFKEGVHRSILRSLATKES